MKDRKNSFKVRAAIGLRVPYETKPRKHITDSESVTVPATAYYLRRIANGELIDQAAARTDAAEKKGA